MVCIHKTFTNIFCTYIYICCSNRYLRDSGVVAPASKTPKTEAAARAFPYQLFGNAPVLAVCYAHVIFNFARYIVYLLRIIYMYILCIDIYIQVFIPVRMLHLYDAEQVWLDTNLLHGSAGREL